MVYFISTRSHPEFNYGMQVVLNWHLKCLFFHRKWSIRLLPLRRIVLLHIEPTDHESKNRQIIAVTATFTAEPVEEPLNFWMNELDIPCAVKFGPYNQVFQQLLDPASTLSTNQSGLNVVLIRLEDWWRGAGGLHPGHGGRENLQERVERNTKDLVDAMKFASGNSRVPYLLCFCPASERIQTDETLARFFNLLEAQIAERLKDLSGTYVVTSAESKALYPVAEYEDQKANEVSHVPYTREFFNGMGTMIARRFYRIHTPPHKVIVLDCDNTLWQGVCGEDGASGVSVGPAYRALQEFIISQRDAGMLVCLCSKNNEEDVWRVFEKNPGMILKREHFVSSRINWQPKSENLRSLSAELQLGVDSFIFLDDSAVECAEVEARCPEVLTFQLPDNTADFQRFLSHVWAFDHLKITEEDRRRSDLYAQNAERGQLWAQSMRLEDFLDGLELQVEFLPMTKAELPRVAQLTQRTNQFNFTSVRRSESEVEQLCSAGNAECLVIQLRDRFGDYGLVGAMIFTRRPGMLDVDNILLSCRALGRRVEHRMLTHLGRIAREEGRGKVRMNFVPTPKNQPARDFLESIGAIMEAGNGIPCQIDFNSQLIADLSSLLLGKHEGGGSLSDATHDTVHRL
jgi:FkbH-like protein